MAWLTLDDKFAHHPKVLALTDKEFRAHITALCYCSAHFTRGVVPAAAMKSLGVSTRIRTKLCEVGLWDQVGNEYEIHDFNVYNGSLEERVGFFLAANPQATANDVCRAVRGKREVVLAVLKQYRTGSLVVPAGTEEVVPGEPENRFLPYPDPDPNPEPEEQDLPGAVRELDHPRDPEANGTAPDLTIRKTIQASLAAAAAANEELPY